MHRFWRQFGSLAELRDPEDAGGGGGFAGSGSAVAEPTYEVPTGVGAGGGEGRQDDRSGAPTSGTPNPGSGGDPAAAASRDGAAAQTQNPNAPQGNQPASGTIPAGRSEEQNGRRQADELNTLRQQVRDQGDVIGKLKAIFSPEAKTDPRLERIRNGILEAVPELKNLLTLPADQLTQVLKTIPALQRQHDTHWETVAERTMADVHKAVMPYVLGPDGKIDQFNDEQKEELAVSFRNWCLRDQTGARVRRYENGDQKLIEDFRDYYASTHHAPAYRSNAAAAAARAAAGRSAPTAGKADVTGTPVPKVESNDEDAVHGAAWKHVSNALRSQG